MFNLGSALLVIALAFGIIRFRTDYLTYVIKVLIAFSVYLNIGYFFKLGTFEFSYAEMLTIILIIVSVFSKFRYRIMLSSILLSLSFGAIIFLGYFQLINNQSPPMVLPVGGSWDRVAFGYESLSPAAFNNSHIMRIVRIALFLMVYFVIDKYVLKNDARTVGIKKFIVKMAVFVAWLGIVEQFFKFFLSSNIVTRIASDIFGVGESQLTVIDQRGSFPAIQGLMLEQGHYALSFIPALLILFRDPLYSENQRIKHFILFAYVIFFSGSFAGFGIILVMIMLFLGSDRKRLLFKIGAITCVGIAAAIFIGNQNPALLDYYLLRVDALLGNVNLGFTTSDSIRMLSSNSALGLFKEYPLLGVGFGTTNVSGFIPSMLSNIGLLGTTLWFIIMFKGFEHTRIVNFKWFLILLPLFFLTGGIRNIYAIDSILMFAFVFRKIADVQQQEEYSLVPVRSL